MPNLTLVNYYLKYLYNISNKILLASPGKITITLAISQAEATKPISSELSWNFFWRELTVILTRPFTTNPCNCYKIQSFYQAYKKDFYLGIVTISCTKAAQHISKTSSQDFAMQPARQNFHFRSSFVISDISYLNSACTLFNVSIFRGRNY